MIISDRFALIKQNHLDLYSICDPSFVSDLRPKRNQKDRYMELLNSIILHKFEIERDFKEGVIDQGAVQRDIPRGLLEYYNNEIIPSLPVLFQAGKTLDPYFLLKVSLYDGVSVPNSEERIVLSTFSAAIEQMVCLVEDEPDQVDAFSISGANKILNSWLIDFEPDGWLKNADELYPVKTARNGAEIPVHAKHRLTEIYRSYTFGNWLSVLSLSRSVLEYVILDNIHKFKIEPTYKITMPKHQVKQKRLIDLIDELGDELPELKIHMDEVRNYGNEFIHPRKTKRSKESLFLKKEKAKKCLSHLLQVVEALYFSLGKKA